MKKRHHYLPRFYLNNFSPNKKPGFIWTYSRDWKIPKFISTKDVAVEKNFYTFTDKDGNKNVLVEENLASMESDVAPIIKKIIQRKLDFTRKEKDELMSFIALLVTRIKYFRDLINSNKEVYYKEMYDIISGNKSLWKKRLKGYNEKMDKNIEMSYEEAVKELTGFENKELEIRREDHLNLAFKIAYPMANRFSRMQWSYLYANGSKKFISSDNPVAASLPGQPKGTSFGLGTPGVNIFLPISSNVCLLGREIGNGIDYDIRNREVDHINGLVIARAHKYIFASFSSMMIQSQFRISKPQKSEDK